MHSSTEVNCNQQVVSPREEKRDEKRKKKKKKKKKKKQWEREREADQLAQEGTNCTLNHHLVSLGALNYYAVKFISLIRSIILDTGGEVVLLASMQSPVSSSVISGTY